MNNKQAFSSVYISSISIYVTVSEAQKSAPAKADSVVFMFPWRLNQNIKDSKHLVVCLLFIAMIHFERKHDKKKVENFFFLVLNLPFA